MSRTLGALHRSKSYAVILVALLAIAFLPDLIRPVTESRPYRDIVGSTPFHSVQIERVELVNGKLIVQGSRVKRRCRKVSHTVYTRRHGGPLMPAYIDVDTEHDTTPTNQPAPQPFGADIWALAHHIVSDRP